MDEVKNDSELNWLHVDPRWQQLLRHMEKDQRDSQEQAARIWDTASLDTPLNTVLDMAVAQLKQRDNKK